VRSAVTIVSRHECALLRDLLMIPRIAEDMSSAGRLLARIK